MVGLELLRIRRLCITQLECPYRDKRHLIAFSYWRQFIHNNYTRRQKYQKIALQLRIIRRNQKNKQATVVCEWATPNIHACQRQH